MIYSSIFDLIGKTPLYKPQNFIKKHCENANLLVKLELFNPAGSIKDRVAANMIKEAEKTGKIKENTVIIEPTSGNTGIGLAAICASKGYKLVLTMPETMSVERRNLLKAYGATLVLTDGSKGMKGAIEKAEELAKENENSFIAGQFYNEANPEAHEKSTGIEIWDDTEGKVDIFVAGVGTGGTLTGTGRYLKSKNESIKLVAIEPFTSAVISGENAGAHKIQGIGAGFIPKNLDTTIIDKIMKVEDNDAFKFGKDFAHLEGILVGISSGAALSAAVKLANEEENHGKTIVAILPDTGERYLSTPMFE